MSMENVSMCYIDCGYGEHSKQHAVVKLLIHHHKTNKLLCL